jgi:hypothetical protein
MIDRANFPNDDRRFSSNTQANSAKYLKEPETINFGAYKNKLRFTGSAVESLEVQK